MTEETKLKFSATVPDPGREPVVVVLKQPSKLFVFTGEGSRELYLKWRAEAEAEESYSRVANSLRGVPKQVARKYNTIVSLLKALDNIYNPQPTYDDRMHALLNAKPNRDEQLVNFFCRLWVGFGEVEGSDDKEKSRVMYHTFMKTAACDRLTHMEMVNKFGEPGVNAPEPEDIYIYLSKLKMVCTAAPVEVGCQLSDSELDKLAERVVKKLNVQWSPSDASTYTSSVPTYMSCPPPIFPVPPLPLQTTQSYPPPPPVTPVNTNSTRNPESTRTAPLRTQRRATANNSHRLRCYICNSDLHLCRSCPRRALN